MTRHLVAIAGTRHHLCYILGTGSRRRMVVGHSQNPPNKSPQRHPVALPWWRFACPPIARKLQVMTDYRDRELVSELNEMYRESRGCEYAEYELRAIAGEGGFAETATSALGFNYEHFEMREAQAVSCNVCGGLFVDSLDVMRRHRHKCGWR